MIFRKHPKELLPIILVNMFAAFAFYTFMSVFILSLSGKVGFESEKTSIIYSFFYFAIFILTFVGGFIADRTRNYKGTVLKGLVLTIIGYIVIAIPTFSSQSWMFLTTIFIALFLIALGNGLFRGNMQAILGQMYDAPNYLQMRDSGFLLFNLFKNIGVLFAPFVANRFMNLTVASGQGTMEISEFATQPLSALSTGFYCVFVLAAITMATSVVIFFVTRKKFPTPAKSDFQNSKMDTKIIKQRVYALLAVFGILNIFCFAFYQDGLTLMSFARDYTELRNWGIDFNKVDTFFIILATPIILTIFSTLRAKGRYPSTLKKMAMGMGIAAVAYLVMILGSIGLPDKTELIVFSETQQVIPFLFGALFILTVAELLIYPLLSSFISQFAQPKHQGIMQSVCLLATSIGNSLMFLSMIMYKHIPVWATWLIFAIICLTSMVVLLLILKWVEKTMKKGTNNVST